LTISPRPHYLAPGRLALAACASLALAACGGASATHSGTATATGTGSATAAGYANVPLAVPAANGGGAFGSSHTLVLRRGWRAEVWARVDAARFMAWSPEHELLVSEPADGKVVALTPGANAAQPPRVQVLVAGLRQPQGLAFDRLAGQEDLYIAESGEIDRYAWRGAAGLGARTVIAHGLPDTDARGDDVHTLKNVVVGPDHTVYVNIGSAFNASATDVRGNPPRASVVAYSPSGALHVIATGVRNGEGLAFAPDGTLWSAVNERDNIAYPFHRSYAGKRDAYGKVLKAYVNEHPPDELVRLTPGRNVGWPYCNPDPDGAGGTLKYASLRFDADAQNNPGGQLLDCATLTPIERGLPAHSAPLGFHFLQGSALPASLRGGALLAAHGSWDRQPPRAPAVLWLPWSRSQRTLGAPVTLVSGFQAANGARWGRPVDALPGPDGAIYVSDDQAGAIYRIVPR
jgi:glucose/arabinose dehydrogenase